MRYHVVVPRSVQKTIDRIEEPYQGRIKAVLALLESNPYSGKRLAANHKGKWTYRVGPFRIIYSIKTKELVVLVIDVGNRRDIYR
jgi:mRNA interferase RelE/StbE